MMDYLLNHLTPQTLARLVAEIEDMLADWEVGLNLPAEATQAEIRGVLAQAHTAGESHADFHALVESARDAIDAEGAFSERDAQERQNWLDDYRYA